MSEPAAVRPAAGPTTGVALILYGGKVRSHAPSRPWHLSAVRMVPFARSLHDAGSRLGLAVWTVRYRYRGWNDREQSPVADARSALEQVRAEHGDVPVALVGHSMGGRTALRVADDPSVTTVVALAPWLPPNEPTPDLRGKWVLIMHGTMDRWTDPRASLALGERLADQTSVRRVAISGDAHSMLRRAELWHGLTTRFVIDQLYPSDQTSPAADPKDQYLLPDEGVHLQR